MHGTQRSGQEKENSLAYSSSTAPVRPQSISFIGALPPTSKDGLPVIRPRRHQLIRHAHRGQDPFHCAVLLKSVAQPSHHQSFSRDPRLHPFTCSRNPFHAVCAHKCTPH